MMNRGLTIQSNDGCYVIANYTEGGVGGYKTQLSWGGWDYWIIKFCDTTLTTSVPIINHNLTILNISPNPANKFVVVSSEFGDKEELVITDILGKTIFK